MCKPLTLHIEEKKGNLVRGGLNLASGGAGAGWGGIPGFTSTPKFGELWREGGVQGRNHGATRYIAIHEGHYQSKARDSLVGAANGGLVCADMGLYHFITRYLDTLSLILGQSRHRLVHCEDI